MPRKKRSTKINVGQDSQLNVINPHSAGIDLGSREHWVCVPPQNTTDNIRSNGLHHTRFTSFG